MEVTLKLKHLLIPLIVIIITFIGLIIELENTVNNTTLDMTFVYSGSDLTIDSDEKFIWNSLNEIQNTYELETKTSSYNTISLEYLNVNTISESQLESLSTKNEIVVILGDHYNKELKELLEQNTDTYFILIDNTAEINQNNVININMDHEKEIATSAQSLSSKSQTKQLLYVSSVPMDDNMENYNLFIDNANGANVAYYYVANVNDSTLILSALAEYFLLGYDGVYVEDASIYNLVVVAAKEAQLAILEENTLANEAKNNPETTSDEVILEETTTTSEEATTEEDSKEEVDLYIQNNIYVVGNYFDNYLDGIYEDTNLDLTYNYLDKSVVFETYTYDLTITLSTIIDQILSGNVDKNNYTLKPIPASTIRPVEEVIPVEEPIEENTEEDVNE